MSLYDRFKNEDEFREQFIRPLLNRLGFFAVKSLHGTQEFGKDFVFSEVTRLGIVKHYAAQVKHHKSIKSGAIIDTLMSQINQSFANTFTLAESAEEMHVSAVYVFNSGKITDNAKTDLRARLTKLNYGVNVHFFDGEKLESLNNRLEFEQGEEA